MKRFLVCSILSAGLSALAFAAPPVVKDVPKEVQQTIDRHYGKADAEVTGMREINGVKAYSVSVKTENGKSGALITEYGDFLFAGNPAGHEPLPQPVQATVEDLFKDTPEHYEIQTATYYDVYVPAKSGKNLKIIVDAAGRVDDIQSGVALNEKGGFPVPDASHLKAADKADVTAIEQVLKSRRPDAKVSNVYEYPGKKGYYVADFEEQGAQGQTVIDKKGAIFAGSPRRMTLADAPPPIKTTLEELFKGVQVREITRVSSIYFQIHQRTPGGSDLQIQIKPDGDVTHVIMHSPQEGAATAGEHMPAKTDNGHRSN